VFGTFLWTDGSQQITAIALPGMPVVNDLTLETGARYAPAINGGGEIVFGARVKNAAGQVSEALFFRDGEGKLLPAALPGQELPGGGTMTGLGGPPSLNDAGMVAFLAVRSGDTTPGAYLWTGPREAGGGALGPVALVGAETPGGGKIERVTGVWVNDRNRTALVAARVAGNSGTSDTLFRFTDGQLTPAVASGQEMPGGGKLQSLQPFGISRANAAGQHAFLAFLEGNATAAYLLEADGKLSLILKEGDTTELGRITQLGGRPEEPTSSFGVGLNGKGQVALPVRIAGGSSTLVLLSPAPATP
jgi:hypothetical protein